MIIIIITIIIIIIIIVIIIIIKNEQYALRTVTTNRLTRNSCVERNYLHFIRGDCKPGPGCIKRP